MKKYNVLSILLILILISFFKFSYPIYDQVYADVDEFKDVDGNYYFSGFDSYNYYGDVLHYTSHDNFSIMLGFVYDMFGVKGLYFLPVIIGILSTFFFFLFVRKLFPYWIAFFSTFFFLIHPSSFFASAKGVLDTDFMIQFLQVLLIILFYSVYKRKSLFAYFCCLLVVFVSYVIWSGWLIFLLQLVMFSFYYILITSERIHKIIFPLYYICGFICSIFFIKWYYASSLNLINQLQTYNFLCLFDKISIPLIFGLLIFYFFSIDDDDDVFLLHIIFCGFMFIILGLFFTRFYYMGLPFMALGLGYVLSKLKKPLLLGFSIVLLTLLFSNLNQPLIIVEDSIVNGVTFADNNSDVIIGLWDLGHVYYAYSDNAVIFRGVPGDIKSFSNGMFLPSDDGISYLDNLSYSKNYSLIVTSYDDKRYETLSNLLGPQITPRSHYLHLDDYFDLAYYGGGENINVSVYVRKT